MLYNLFLEVSMMKADCLQSVSHISGQSLSMGIYETSAPDLVTMSECGSPTQKSITSQYGKYLYYQSPTLNDISLFSL